MNLELKADPRQEFWGGSREVEIHSCSENEFMFSSSTLLLIQECAGCW